MKSFIPYSLLLAAAACGVAYGQTTAYTKPVGYVSIPVPAASDTVVGPSLNRAADYVTTAVSASGTNVTINASGLAANKYTYASGTQPNHYFILFQDGLLAGQFVPIISNAASISATTVLTLSTAVTFSGTPKVSIIPFWTLDTFFPGGAGVGTQNDPGSTDQNVLFFDQDSVGANLGQSPADTYSYYDGSQGGSAGWYGVNSGNPAGETVIEPTKLMLVRNSGATALTITTTGYVPTETIVSPIYSEAVTQDNAISLRYPVDVPLAMTGLCTATPNGLGGYTFSGPVTPVNDPGSLDGDSVLVYDYNPASEDGNGTAAGFNFNPEKVYVFYDGSQGGAAEWYNVNSGSPDNPLIKAGRGFIVRKAAGAVAALTWSQPIPYTTL